MEGVRNFPKQDLSRGVLVIYPKLNNIRVYSQAIIGVVRIRNGN